MDRRNFLMSGAALPLVAGLPRFANAQQLPFNPQPGAWRTFEITTRVEVLKPAGATRVWLPAPAVEDGSQKPLDNSWSGNASAARMMHDGKHGAAIFYAEWTAPPATPAVELTSRFMTRDRVANLSRPDPSLRLDAADMKFYTAPTDLQPTDGIVRKTALEITKGAKTDVEKSRAIYEWIVDNTERNPTTRGCGVGDIKAMLETGNLTGKCADLNALYVGLARAVGLPARDIYGIRVAKSNFGYRSLGAGTENVTRA
ncbi:MAG TPA: transglutaminase domain-containing protein, partial [Burkholderiales bacterium]|nr:transglutaminase domain-containing protein [Burkholderiales bacterium]